MILMSLLTHREFLKSKIQGPLSNFNLKGGFLFHSHFIGNAKCEFILTEHAFSDNLVMGEQIYEAMV